ncbi:MAG: LicD family protein [Candidatus Saccharibacteria bacterium]|nr:LicD family protein [Candidatus Saccharibacteria bacterium]
MIKREPTELQSVILDIYKEIKKICDDNDITFYSEGATTIGAMLYGGFVPWDDDIDIRMARKDYDRFKKIAPKLLPVHLKVHDGMEDPNADYVFMKVHDTRTMFTRNHLADFPKSYTGVFVDIAPIDGASSDIETRDKLFRELDILNLKNLIRKTKKRLDYDYFVDRLRLLDDNVNDAYLRAIFDKPANFYARQMHKLASGYDFNNSYYSVTLERAGVDDLRRYDSLCHEYTGVIEVKFEDTKMPVPVGYKDIMRKMLGFDLSVDRQKDFERESHNKTSGHIGDAVVSLTRSIDDFAGDFKRRGVIENEYSREYGVIAKPKYPKITFRIKRTHWNNHAEEVMRSIKFQTEENFVCEYSNDLEFNHSLITHDGRFIDERSDINGWTAEVEIDLELAGNFIDRLAPYMTDDYGKIAVISGNRKITLTNSGGERYTEVNGEALFKECWDPDRVINSQIEYIERLRKEIDDTRDSIAYRVGITLTAPARWLYRLIKWLGLTN